jgi:hypothetical protein
MARTIATQPQAVIDVLAREFEIEGDEGIGAFLERYPDVAPLLLEIRSAIKRFFGEERVSLELFYDPECEIEDPELFVNILTQFPAGEALKRLKRFDHEWWLEKFKKTDAPLVVSIKHMRRD